MTRRCSHCGHNGHNARTCPDRGVRLFGVRLTDGVTSMNMRKSVSMNNLSHYSSANNPPSPPEDSESGAAPDGYVSDGLVQTSNNARERKKGVPWTEEEHRLFLLGLQKLGKGDWRGISRNFVQTRTPTQVASHAQKYFIRQSNMNKRKRRSSLFDIVSELGVSTIAEESTSSEMAEMAEMATPLHQLGPRPTSLYPSGLYYEPSQLQSFGISVGPFSMPVHMAAPMAMPLMSVGNSTAVTADQVMEVVGLGSSAESSTRVGLQRPVAASAPIPPGGTGLCSLSMSHIPYPFAMWPGLSPTGYPRPLSSSPQNSKLVRPTATIAAITTAPAKIDGEDETKEMSQLSLGLSPPEPSQLTLKLLDQRSRHSSAFHVNSSFDTSSLQQGVNSISVV